MLMSFNSSIIFTGRAISKIIVLVLCVLLLPQLNAQVSDLGLMQGLSQELAKQQSMSLPIENEDQGSEADSSRNLKNKQDLENENFGFTGGDRFNANPMSRFNKKPLNYFGYDFFRDAPSTFVPLRNVPVPQDYIIGPGDNVKVLLFGNRNNKTKYFNG